MKVFVAGRWSDRERIREIMSLVQALGHTITRDWTAIAVADDDMAGHREIALGDLEGVRQAEIFIFVADQDFQWRGAYAELGAAIALGKPCYIIGDYADKCIYVYHPLVQKVKSIEEVFNVTPTISGAN